MLGTPSEVRRAPVGRRQYATFETHPARVSTSNCSQGLIVKDPPPRLSISLPLTTVAVVLPTRSQLRHNDSYLANAGSQISCLLSMHLASASLCSPHLYSLCSFCQWTRDLLTLLVIPLCYADEKVCLPHANRYVKSLIASSRVTAS